MRKRDLPRRCLAKWYARWRAHGENGLLDHSSRPSTSPARTPEDLADLVEAQRRQTKHGPARLAADLRRLHGVTLAPTTVHRILARRGLNRLRDLDPPAGAQLREVIRYEHDRIVDLVHVDVRKLGRIPTGGWRMHGVDTESARASKRTGTGKVGYTYLHSARDDHSRLAYTRPWARATSVPLWPPPMRGQAPPVRATAASPTANYNCRAPPGRSSSTAKDFRPPPPNS
ncbi:helix-turn-helix domain-containing protein [Streptomyces sp. NPDC001817]|uniref:helix-turn-helix domain-containing protein n=1 Tax=Streptomyces sp. NPDC001817 TaxID=3154398 RepID=UPI0033178542